MESPTNEFDEKSGRAYCLVPVPNPAAANAVHEEAQGLMTNEHSDVQEGRWRSPRPAASLFETPRVLLSGGARLKRRSLYLWIFVFLATVAVALVWGAGAAQAACAKPWWAPNFSSFDTDGDTLPDSAGAAATYSLAGPVIYASVNLSLQTPDGSTTVAYSVANVSSSGVPQLGLRVTLPPDQAPNGWLAVASFDEGSGVCTAFNATLSLYPLGVYNITLSADNPDQQADQNTTVIYDMTVVSHSSNVDTLYIGGAAPAGWVDGVSDTQVLIGPGGTAHFAYYVLVPLNAPPLSQGVSRIDVISKAKSSVHETAYHTTTVKPQVFAINLTAAGATEGAAPPGANISFVALLENHGNNGDRIAVNLSSAPAGWGVVLSQSSPWVNAGESATLTVEVRLPSALTFAVEWTANLSALSSDNTTGAAITLHASILLPDLTVAPADIFVDDLAPRAGDRVGVKVTVRNVGEPLTLDTVVVLSDGAANLSTVVSLGALGVGFASFNWTAVAGNVTLRVVLDPTHAIPEVSETNNEAALAVVVNGPPIARAGSDRLLGFPGSAVTLSGAGSLDPDGTVVAYLFVFGDGADSGWVNASEATHAYASAGTYNASLRVRDNSGLDSQNISITVFVDALPVAAVEAGEAAGQVGQPLTLSAANSSDADGSVAAYYFDFGDGSNTGWTSNASASHTYSAAGTYTVTVRVRDNSGAESANATQTVTVRAAVGPKGFLPGLGAFVAIAALGAVAAGGHGRPLTTLPSRVRRRVGRALAGGRRLPRRP